MVALPDQLQDGQAGLQVPSLLAKTLHPGWSTCYAPIPCQTRGSSVNNYKTHYGTLQHRPHGSPSHHARLEDQEGRVQEQERNQRHTRSAIQQEDPTTTQGETQTQSNCPQCRSRKHGLGSCELFPWSTPQSQELSVASNHRTAFANCCMVNRTGSVFALPTNALVNEVFFAPGSRLKNVLKKESF